MTNQEVRDLRKAVDTVIFAIEQYQHDTHDLSVSDRQDLREMALARTKLQEAKLWLGMALGARGDSGYPQELLDHCEERSV